MNRKYDIVFFDFDGTLAVSDDNLTVWTHIRERIGSSPESKIDRHKRYQEGTLSFDGWVEEEVGDWHAAGLRKQDIEDEIQKNLRLHNHAHTVLHRLKKEGYKLVLVSGGLRIALDTIFPDHPFDETFIGNVEFDHEGKIIGTTKNPFADTNGKVDAVRLYAERESTPLERVVFVGDWINDIEAMRIAKFSIAFNSDEKAVRETATVIVDSKDYRDILPHLLHKV